MRLTSSTSTIIDDRYSLNMIFPQTFANFIIHFVQAIRSMPIFSSRRSRYIPGLNQVVGNHPRHSSILV